MGFNISDIINTAANPFRLVSQFGHAGKSIKDYITGETSARINSAYNLKTMAAQYAYNLGLQENAQEFNAAEAMKNRAWQEKLANSAYQRARMDLEKANLNPLLSLMQGGAATPSSSPASSPSASVSALGVNSTGKIGEVAGAVMAGMNTIGAAAQLGGKIRQQNADIAATQAETRLKDAQTAQAAADTEWTLQKSGLLKPSSSFVRTLYDNAPAFGERLGDWLGSKTTESPSIIGKALRLLGVGDTGSAKASRDIDKAVESISKSRDKPSSPNDEHDNEMKEWSDWIHSSDAIKKFHRQNHSTPRKAGHYIFTH